MCIYTVYARIILSATVIDLTWENANSEQAPQVSASFVKCSYFFPDENLQRECHLAYNVLLPATICT